ncbi:LuxR family transcriptional regulator [Planotetraspora silvatica]|uniref:LuxR family transcriptional regulator n=1 Tax=Planotetraspora silvatica TaxID=234614 RepID=A0A8J3UI58_9ACTN|nr:LuxR family transcriptional regulator [Planotetraspora silvatica]GII45743.1 LuxR family transcriptional regulator [Planotetraspora silvatica]
MTTGTGGFGHVDPDAVDELFVGRARESDRLRYCAGKVRAGDSWLAVIEGEAGIGKSALVRRFAASLDDFTVLRAIGDPSEADLPYGVIGQLTRHVERAVLKQFPLLAESPPAGTNPHVVGGQLLLLLGALQESGNPVAVIVDDVQWADRLSVQLLGFVLRRLWADRVLTILVIRPEAEASGETLERLLRSSERTVKVDLGGLGGGEIAQLAQALIEGRLAPGLADRLYAYTRGHPLYVRTVLAEIPADVLRDGVLERWPVPRSLQVGIRAQLDRLPQESRDLLEAMAVLDAQVPLSAVGRLADLPDPARALGPALAAGLALWWPKEPQSPVALVHALQRDTIYDSLAPERRRSLHAGAAALVGTAASWAHRVAAAATTDARLSDELDRSGMEEAASGRNAVAATRLLWASSLSADRADRERRLLTACAQSLLTMQPGWAANLRQQVEDCSPGPLRSCVLGTLDMMAGRFATAEAHLTQAWQEALSLPKPGWVAVLAGTFLTNIMLWRGRGAETVEIARRTLAIGDLDPATTDFTRAALATGRLWHEGPRAALRDLAYLPVQGTTVGNHNLDTLATRGVLRLFLGELSAARADLQIVAQRDQQGAGSKFGPLTISLLSVVHYVAGDWDESESTAERALAVASSQDQLAGEAPARFAAVCVKAGRGEWDIAQRHLDDLARIAQSLDSAAEIVYSSLAAATVAQARADYPALLRSLRPLLDGTAEDGGFRLRDKPFWLWQQSLLIEALTGTGRVDAAAVALRELRAAYDGDGYLGVVVARLGGQLAEAQGRPHDALAIYEQAVAADADTDTAPLYRAIVEQAYGRLLLATGSTSRREAAAWLHKAHGRFSTLRAVPFVRRCEADMSASGLTAFERDPSRLSALTERELSVAHIIASGRTNQEAAAELYVSQKTVEYHLSRIYAKLGISSRRQLSEALRSP